MRNPTRMPEERPAPDATWVLIASILGSSMSFIDSTAVNVSLPLMQRNLNAGVAGIQWVVEGYALFLSALILVGGALGDRYGRKRIFALGILIFTIASVGCAISQTIEQIIIARCLQGVGGALLTPGSLALISGAFPPSMRGRAFGIWSSAAIVTTTAGPLLGGWLAQSFSWRYVFAINVPIAIFVLFALSRCVRETRDPKAAVHIDMFGAALATLGLGALVYGLIRLQQTPDTFGLIASIAGVVILLLFLLVESRIKNAMMPLDTFGNRVFLAGNLYTLLLYASLGGSLFFVPFDLINIHHYSPLAAGAATLPTVILIGAFSERSGELVNRIGPRAPLSIGAFIAAVGFLLYARIGTGGPYWSTFLPAAVLVGAGAACFVAPLTTTVMNAISTERAGLASGINNAVARTASLIAIAVLGLILASAFSHEFAQAAPAAHISARTTGLLTSQRPVMLTGHAPANLPINDRARAATLVANSYQYGFRLAMLASAVLAFIAAAIAFLMLKKS